MCKYQYDYRYRNEYKSKYITVINVRTYLSVHVYPHGEGLGAVNKPPSFMLLEIEVWQGLS